MRHKVTAWKCLENKDGFMVRSGDNLQLTSKWWGGKEVCPGDGEATKLLISFKAIRPCEFPSSLFWQCSDGLDPVHISALLGIPTGITCLSFFSRGCVLGCQQLRWWHWWREGWEPWPRADLSEHPVPEGDYVQHPLPAVADAAEAEGAQVKAPALRFSGSLTVTVTVTVLPASGGFQCKMEGFEHRNGLELLGKCSMRML